MALNYRQLAFCRHLVGADGQPPCAGADAARLAGYARSNAAGTADDLLGRADVQAHLAELRAELEARALLNFDEAQRIIAAIARNSEAKDRDRLAALKLNGEWCGWGAARKPDDEGDGPRFVVVDPGE